MDCLDRTKRGIRKKNQPVLFSMERPEMCWISQGGMSEAWRDEVKAQGEASRDLRQDELAWGFKGSSE